MQQLMLEQIIFQVLTRTVGTAFGNKTVDNIEEAVSVLSKSYPETNYNFQMIHTDRYDPTSSEWMDFGQIINKYTVGAFVTNEL
jgi:hypothetical protein